MLDCSRASSAGTCSRDVSASICAKGVARGRRAQLLHGGLVHAGGEEIADLRLHGRAVGGDFARPSRIPHRKRWLS